MNDFLRMIAGVLALTWTTVASAAVVEVDSDCLDQGSVSWSEKSLTNGTVRLTMKATAAANAVFSGWSFRERDVVAWTDDVRDPGPLSAVVATNATVTALFVARSDDSLAFDIAETLPEKLTCGETFSGVLDVDSVSFPTVTFKNLPPGLTYDARTLTLFGSPTAPGIYEVSATAVNGSGFTFESFRRVRVANLEGARVSGVDREISAGEYFYAEPDNLFSYSEAPTAFSLRANVPGLVWNESWQLLYGTPTVPGDYTLTATVRFATGVSETATLTLSVVRPDPGDYGLDLEVLEDLQVGDVLDETSEIAVDSATRRLSRVTGLPSGLVAVSRMVEGVRRWTLEGTVHEPGFFAVTADVLDSSGETQKVVTVQHKVTVMDLPETYLDAQSADSSRGTVSGGGAVSPDLDVTLVAKPLAGFVFAGWYDSFGERLVLVDGVDYRTPSVTLPAGTPLLFLSPVAQFVAEEEDDEPNLSELDGEEFTLSPDAASDVEFFVDSLSKPELTFENLPKGMTCQASGSGSFYLRYDPTISEADSGRYDVSVLAVNESGRSTTAAFRITIGNRTNARLHIEDDYGEFAPDEAIEAIDLSDAVDFTHGEKLTVSGLPKGLVYNAKANQKKGIEAHTITGTPTKSGEYTLTFKAILTDGTTATATAFLTVLPDPELLVDLDETAAAAGCKVTGSGRYRVGSRVSLRATVAKGWVFAGWQGLDAVEGLAALNPKLTLVTSEFDQLGWASFVPVSEDELTISQPAETVEGFAAVWSLQTDLAEDDAALVADLIETVSWPTVKVSGLPAGVKFSATTFALSGAPKKSGVYAVTVSAKNAGGYSFVRVIKVAVRNVDGSLPTEEKPVNDAQIDFGPLTGFTTGVYVPTGTVALTVSPRPETGAAVRKVALTGLPSGLSGRVSLAADGATVEISGTPTKPGLQKLSVTVTYAAGGSLKSKATIIVEDGGSDYLFVSTDDAADGTVSGAGVYAAGETVMLVAKAKSKHVFAGWTNEGDLFTPLREIDGVDPRTASVSFPFRQADFFGGYELTGLFVSSAEDASAVLTLEDTAWAIDPTRSSAFAFTVDSLSLPKVAVSGLPKGVTLDAARGRLLYEPTAATAPGIYTATITAKNLTQKKATVKTLEIQVANRVSTVIGGLDPATDAYPLTVGTALDPARIVPSVDEDWSLTAKGLPSGLTFKNGVLSGVPTKAGDYTVTFAATRGSGSQKQTETATVTLRIASLPATLAGTFSGVLEDASGTVAGTVTATATAAGKISVVTKMREQSDAFKSSNWQILTNGVASVEMTNAEASRLHLSVATNGDWRSWQATGTLSVNAETFSFRAQRNPFERQGGDEDARRALAALVGSHVCSDGSLKITATGQVKFSGRYNGQSLSGTMPLQVEDNAYFAQYVKFLNDNSAIYLLFEIAADGTTASVSVREL